MHVHHVIISSTKKLSLILSDGNFADQSIVLAIEAERVNNDRHGVSPASYRHICPVSLSKCGMTLGGAAHVRPSGRSQMT